MNRYHRQILIPQIGEKGQQRLASSRVLLIGCGALGTVIAEQLVRAGIGHITICDRDIVELTNLQRQTLFDERDAHESLPKAIAAQRRLRQINSTIEIDAKSIDVHSGNIESLLPADVIIDGTDNVETRYLINDVAVKHRLPWVYGACVSVTARAMGIVPDGPCLRCLFPEPPAAGELPTCDTVGVLAAASAIAASLQVVETMKILMNDPEAGTNLVTFDLWPLRIKTISTAGAKRPDCPTCGLRNFEFFNRPTAGAVALCGRDTVQIRSSNPVNLSLIASKLAAAGDVQKSDFFLRCGLRDSSLILTLFPDGRALIHGTSDPALARSIYAKFIGS